MTSIGVLFFRSSQLPCIKRLEACLCSCSIQISWCCAGPWVGLAQLAYLSHLADSRSQPYDSEGRSSPATTALAGRHNRAYGIVEKYAM
jgi:hypothetical protein